MISQMIVGIRDQNIEHDPAPELLQILVWCGSTLTQRFDYLEIRVQFVI
jgi:hypothetical protein